MEEKIKVFSITPSPNRDFDSIYYRITKETWEEILDMVEIALDAQFLGEEGFDNIKVTIECKEMTEREFEELCEYD